MGDHGYAAFTPEDREDAKRRRPAATLEGYAAERGLEYRGRGMLAGFRGALPMWEEEQHNLMRGVLPGGRFGVLLHELLKTHSDASEMPGTFYGVRTSSTVGFWRSIRPDRTDIPILGNFLDGRTEEQTSAFQGQGAWSPVTTAATPVPETVSRIGRMVFTVKDRTPFINSAQNLDLEPFGVRGWRAAPGELVTQDDLPRLLAGPVGHALGALGSASFAQVLVERGMVVVKRNGYLMDPQSLDEFATTTCVLADGLAAACLDGRRPPPFDRPLAPCPWEVGEPNTVYAGLPKAWEDDFRGFAQGRGWTLEDPRDWHEQFPSAPVPGEVLAAMRTPSGLRVLFPVDVPVHRLRAVRGAIAFPVADGTADTPPGGIASVATQTTTAVRDGIGVVWTHRHFGYTREAETLVHDALAAAREAGVQPVVDGP